MAKKVLKTRSQITSTLKKELYSELKNLSDTTDIPISKLLDQSVELLLAKKGMPRDPNKTYIDVNLPE